MEHIKITAVVGSLRKDSLNRQLAMAAKETVGSQAEVTLLEYGDVPFMNQDIEFPAPEAVRRVREQIKASDGIWFFTPEYNHYFSGVLKNLLDWLSRPVSEKEPQVLLGKPATVSGVSLGMSGTCIAQDHLVTLLTILNMEVMNAPRVAVAHAMQQLDDSGNLRLTASAEFLTEQCDAFVRFVRSRRNR